MQRPANPDDRPVQLPGFERRDQQRLSVSVAEALKEMIRDGELQPGDRLPNEAALCEHFGVSRITLREAMQVLRGLGLVEPTRGRGTFVREPDPSSFLRDLAYFAFADASSVEDLFEVRGLLEVRAAQRAAARVRDEDADQLVTIVREGRDKLSHASTDDLHEIARADTQFHLQIAAMSGNLVLEQLMHRLMQILEVARARSLTIHGQPERSWQQHLKIATAIADGNAELAAEHTRAHMRDVKSAILGAQVS